MRKLINFLIVFGVFYFGISTPLFAYNTDPLLIASSHVRSSYYLNNSVFGSEKSFEEFLKSADRNTPVVIHSHGCGGVMHYEAELKNFYTGLGYNFVTLDFHRRDDASPSCSFASGFFRYHGNMRERVKVRSLELKHHINILKENGFKKLVASGHSEGGFVVQMIDQGVQGVIVHAMFCNPMANGIDNRHIEFLHLVSLNDPLLTRPGLSHTCNDRKNYKTIISQVESHSPLADHNWKNDIKNFLSGIK